MVSIDRLGCAVERVESKKIIRKDLWRSYFDFGFTECLLSYCIEESRVSVIVRKLGTKNKIPKEKMINIKETMAATLFPPFCCVADTMTGIRERASVGAIHMLPTCIC